MPEETKEQTSKEETPPADSSTGNPGPGPNPDRDS